MPELFIAFGGSPLDRADAVRADPARLAALVADGARLLRLDGLAPVLGPDNALQWSAAGAADPAAELVFLGLRDGRAWLAPVAPGLKGNVGAPNPVLRQAMALLPAEDLAIYGGARALVDWHARHRFCARCGAGTLLAKGGWQRDCTDAVCGAQHFPRVDPVTIMLTEHDGKVLLGRQPLFPAGRYSALAGFVEPGETVEEAVAREVMEEAGVRVRDVTYVASQPWPFPSSLMIGCHAHADDPALTLDLTELEDARWFSREEVVRALAGEPDAAFGVPTETAIAHQLLKWWVARGA